MKKSKIAVLQPFEGLEIAPAMYTYNRKRERVYRTRIAGRRRRPRYLVPAIALISAVLVGISAIVVVRLLQYRDAQQEYAAYRAMAEQAEMHTPEPQPVVADAAALDAMMTPDNGEATLPDGAAVAGVRDGFRSARVSLLKKENKDTVGWIDIPNTGIQYPVVQGKDNEYYVTHTFGKKSNDSGAIFMDSANAPNFDAFNTVIYGHNMKDGSMFNGLREYAAQSFADAHGRVVITQLDSEKKYQVFSAYMSKGEDDFDFRGFGNVSEVQRREFIRAIRKRSDIASTTTVRVEDRLLTLVTCTSGTHPWYWVVHAVLVDEKY